MSKTPTQEPGRAYGYRDAEPSHSLRYLQAPIDRMLAARVWPAKPRALDYGCGSGWFANYLAGKGFAAAGVDISTSGIEVAQANFPKLQFSTDVTTAGLERLGPFDLVTCLEVIAHCYKPAEELARIAGSLVPGGMLILSTPYHGYLKNLAMAVTGRLEHHLDTSWPGAYVHYFTPASITKLLDAAGFRDIKIARAGRIPPLANSMILSCTKPS